MRYGGVTDGARAVAIRTPLGSIELAGSSFCGVLWARVECDCRARCCLMDGVDHHLEQGQAFWRNPEASADHHAVIGSPLQRFFQRYASGLIRCDHASDALPSAFADLCNGDGNACVDLLCIEAWRQGGVGEVYGLGLLANKQYTGQMLSPFTRFSNDSCSGFRQYVHKCLPRALENSPLPVDAMMGGDTSNVPQCVG